MTARRLGRTLHPVAWWIWALGLAAAVSRTTNPLLLVLVLAVLAVVVTSRRSEAPWARAFRYYLILAGSVIAVRVLFRAVFSGAIGPDDHVLFRLPQLHPPTWLAGVSLGGPVTAEATVSAAVDGLRLGVLLCCVGAANVLADPKRALRVLPGALYELGVTVTVALSAAPQLAQSVQRVRRARRLRGAEGHGLRRLRAVAVPVLEDAFERSLALAASMDSRGYGRTGSASRAARRLTGVLLVLGMLGLCGGVYGLYDASAPAPFGVPAMAAGAVLAALGLALGGRRVHRSSYRPDRWRLPECAVVASAAGCVALVGWGAREAALNPVFSPLGWPTLPLAPALGVLLAALPAVTAPPPPVPTRRVRPAGRTAPVERPAARPVVPA